MLIKCIRSKISSHDRIVGKDDGGVMFSEKKYEEYKKKNPHKVKAAHKGFTDILAREDMLEMQDPASIMAQAKGGSIEGY